MTRHTTPFRPDCEPQPREPTSSSKGLKAYKASQPGPSVITTITSAALVILIFNNQPQRERINLL